MQIARLRSQLRRFRHSAEVGRAERNGNRPAAGSAKRQWSRWLLPISTLSTGLHSHLALCRIGRAAHCHQVIGTAVPASPDRRQRQDGAAGDQRSDLRGRQWDAPSGVFRASREEAPEEMVFRQRDAARISLRTASGKAGRGWNHPKKGRGTSVGFGLRARQDRSKEQLAFGQSGSIRLVRLLLGGSYRSEATPELVRRSSRLGSPGIRLRNSTNPSLGAVGAGSDAGPHFFCGYHVV